MSHSLLRDPDAFLLPGSGPIAIDTEFHAENRYRPRLHLIQVRAEGGPIHLIDPHAKDLVAAIAPALLQRDWLVHAGRMDLPLLFRSLGGVPPRVLDTQIAAGLIDTNYPAGLARLLSTHLGIHLPKGETMSNWAARPLSEQQLLYAAADVDHLHELWGVLYQAVSALGRQDVLEEACLEARRTSLAGPNLDRLWRSIPGGLGLEEPHAGVLHRLAVYREQVAAETDRPSHTVLGNRILLDLAKRRPTNLDALLAGRRGPKKALAAHATALLEAISKEEPPVGRSHFPLARGTLRMARLQWLQAWAGQCASKGQWSAGLVLPKSWLERMAIHPDDRPHDWRYELIGKEMAQALGGDFSLTLPTIE